MHERVCHLSVCMVSVCAYAHDIVGRLPQAVRARRPAGVQDVLIPAPAHVRHDRDYHRIRGVGRPDAVRCICHASPPSSRLRVPGRGTLGMEQRTAHCMAGECWRSGRLRGLCRQCCRACRRRRSGTGCLHCRRTARGAARGPQICPYSPAFNAIRVYGWSDSQLRYPLPLVGASPHTRAIVLHTLMSA